jgi:hypothetical protein
MRYAIGINFEGSSAVEPEGSGGRLVSLQGSGGPPESTDQWQLSLQSRPESAERRRAALAIVGPLGDRINALSDGEALDAITDASGSVEGNRVDLRFNVTGGTGGFAGASGDVRLHGTLLPQGFFLTADLDLEVRDGAWRPPDARPITAAEDAAGGSHVGPQPLSQGEAEAGAEEDLVRRSRHRPG